eukprot:CAMPEP_0116963272 /NCGR_PEP_ID=MMETSP0467-20121206/47804_1 /TAXON_ID=283647 /ORGANISM="Mesodinium pulex, Strain SPMC105" /LENGTH=65 /DNA_ID=CAMNT_0004651853 /DNA_START=563 /DNA_END=760 /DNA_ORIENTATION=-
MGSIRIPAACCGCYGFKSSKQFGNNFYAQPVSTEGDYMPLVDAVAGPLCRNFSDLNYFAQHFYSN